MDRKVSKSTDHSETLDGMYTARSSSDDDYSLFALDSGFGLVASDDPSDL